MGISNINMLVQTDIPAVIVLITRNKTDLTEEATIAKEGITDADIITEVILTSASLQTDYKKYQHAT